MCSEMCVVAGGPNHNPVGNGDSEGMDILVIWEKEGPQKAGLLENRELLTNSYLEILGC